MEKRTIVKDFLNKTSGAGIYDRYPDISKRDRWEKLPAGLKEDLTEAGEEAAKEPWTQLLISDFTEFSKTGNRLRFEDKYFPRRRKLSKLVIAECVENKGRFIDDILDGLYLILEESTWCLPAHNTYIRDKKAEYLPNVLRPVIDLFDAETGALAAMTEYLLRPVFEKISPYISQYVNERLSERIFDPYKSYHFWWMGNGQEPMCNWTPWCTQNVLICALTRAEDFFTEKERRFFLEKAAASLDYFLDEYGDDGCCNEGAQYYSHAGLCLFGALELMDGALEQGDGAKELREGAALPMEGVAHSGEGAALPRSVFSEVFRNDLIRNIGNYIVKMHAGGDFYINYADCSMQCEKRGAREYLYGKKSKDTALMSFAADDFARADQKERLIPDEINLFYRVLLVFTYEEMMASGARNETPPDTFFESTGLMIGRDGVYTLAAKAGNNADSHNHNDVGSFTVFKDSRPMIIDLGAPTYTGKTFSERRYEIWTMQSQFHNLPTFLKMENPDDLGRNPESDAYDSGIVMQRDGKRYFADAVKCTMDENKCELSMDIATAYGNDCIAHYYRSVTLEKGSRIVVSDEYRGELTAVVSVMLPVRPAITEGEEIVLDIPKLGSIKATGASKVCLQEYAIDDPKLESSWGSKVFRALFTISEEGKLKLIIE